MSPSHQDEEFVAYVLELTQAVGPVYAKRMFSGHGLFLEGIMFAVIAKGTLYLKTDAETEIEYAARELDAFSYTSRNRTIRLSYRQAPSEALENAEDMALWAGKAYRSALRSAAKK